MTATTTLMGTWRGGQATASRLAPMPPGSDAASSHTAALGRVMSTRAKLRCARCHRGDTNLWWTAAGGSYSSKRAPHEEPVWCHRGECKIGTFFADLKEDDEDDKDDEYV